MRCEQERVRAAAAVLRGAHKVWLTTHVKSDGDGIGCELALARALRASGKDARIINDTLIPRDLRFLEGEAGEVLLYDPRLHDDFLKAADTIVVLDVGVPSRLGRLRGPFEASRAQKVCLDHHWGCDGDFHWVLSDPDSGSTGEILYNLLSTMGASITPDVATPLFAAVSIDTGSFSYERCTEKTFRIAADLVASGADPYAIHVALNWQRRIDGIRLEGEVIQNLQVDDSGRIAYSRVTLDALGRYKMDPMEMPTVVNIPLSLAGVEVALLFVEVGPRSVTVSARSKGPAKVNVLAAEFGGGGHPLAAGFSIEGSLEEAEDRVLPSARRLLGVQETPGGTADPGQGVAAR